MTFGILFSVLLLLTGITFILLIYLGIVKVDDTVLGKSVLVIAIGVVSGVFLMVAGCCCLECLRTQQITVSTMYNRDGKSHRSRRERKSSYARS